MVEFDDISVDSDLKPESSRSKGRSKVKSSRGKGKRASNKDSKSKRKGVKKSKSPKTSKKSQKKSTKKVKVKIKYNPAENFMVPKHEILSEEEKEELVKRYGSLDYFPMILTTDPIVESIGAKEGDVIRIHREEGYYYRRVVSLRSS